MQNGRRILCVPFASILGNAQKNCARILDLARGLADAGENPDLIVLPELALSGYLLESLVAETAMTAEELTAFAVSLITSGLPPRTEWIVGVPLREGSEVFNAAVVLREGRIAHIHRKLFLPTYGMFDESRYFTRGSAFTTYDGIFGKSVILICEDAWHLELAYAASEARAETVIVISSSPARGYLGGNGFDSSQTWRSRLKVFADSYGHNYVYCNRSGVEDGVLYDGTTFVVDGVRFLDGESVTGNASARRYVLPETPARHAGFIGNSARQNDLAVLKEIFQRL